MALSLAYFNDVANVFINICRFKCISKGTVIFSIAEPCADPESLARGGRTLTSYIFNLVDEGREDPNTIPL